MNDLLSDFLENVLLAGDAIPLDIKAYRMDGTSPGRNMRVRAGLGTGLSCCDYLHICGERRILIEDTRLGKTIADMQSEYNSLQPDQRNKFVRKRINRDICLKVYGSMLMLCRLDLWPDAPGCSFWLVMNDVGEEAGGMAKVVSYISPNDELRNEVEFALMGDRTQASAIKDALVGARLVADVKVMTGTEFRGLSQGIRQGIR